MIKNITKFIYKNKSQLKKGDKIYLYNRNFKISRRSKKLNPVKDGLFLVKDVREQNVILKLPPEARVYSKFYNSFLIKTDLSTSLQII